MSGDNFYFGDNVNMHGGTGNTGMVKNQVVAPNSAAGSAELEAAVGELLRLVEQLRGQVAPVSAQAIDDSLPAISSDGSTPPQERHRALLAVAGIATTVGVVGQPVIEAVNKILELLGGR
ncbi:hypothetical protein ACFV2U_09085 [Streptomyces sp. NPDC059697]|uniref:hypothetical protein n=1 Tax=Streptomyces sp. NPDC059697 TaxID=3346912 RepID=UPI0036BF0B9C